MGSRPRSRQELIAEGPDGVENVRSLVLLVRHAGRSVLLTGDLEKAGLDRVLGLPPPDVDLLLYKSKLDLLSPFSRSPAGAPVPFKPTQGRGVVRVPILTAKRPIRVGTLTHHPGA